MPSSRAVSARNRRTAPSSSAAALTFIEKPEANIARATIFGAVFILIALAWVAYGVQKSPYLTRQGVVRPQPVPFSHEHHVKGLGIDCRYCHTSLEDSSFAGIPATETCMTCHSKI